jgi:predicted Zn-dependent protease
MRYSLTLLCCSLLLLSVSCQSGSKKGGGAGYGAAPAAQGLWKHRTLRWRYAAHTTPSYLSAASVTKEIQRCFDYWQGAGVFRFSQASDDEPADIQIAFGKPAEAAFDSEHDQMAFGFYPWSSHPGQIYLDPTEKWSTSDVSFSGEPITDWMPHEIGHVLGLKHSHSERDVMHAVGPFSAPSNGDFKALRALYGQ